VLLPVFFIGAAIAIVISVTIAHFGG